MIGCVGQNERVSCVSPWSTTHLLNIHDDEYHDDDMRLFVFLKSTSMPATSPMSIVNGMKRRSIDARLNVVSSLDVSIVFIEFSLNETIADQPIECHHQCLTCANQRDRH
jgi:hypothetical protein